MRRVTRKSKRSKRSKRSIKSKRSKRSIKSIKSKRSRKTIRRMKGGRGGEKSPEEEKEEKEDKEANGIYYSENIETLGALNDIFKKHTHFMFYDENGWPKIRSTETSAYLESSTDDDKSLYDFKDFISKDKPPYYTWTFVNKPIK